jgi:hypothetical protein
LCVLIAVFELTRSVGQWRHKPRIGKVSVGGVEKVEVGRIRGALLEARDKVR